MCLLSKILIDASFRAVYDKLAGTYNDRLQGGPSSSQMLSSDNDADLHLMRQKEDTSGKILSLDNDGDLVLTRRTKNYWRCWNRGLTIQHSITSSLSNVGLQVWRAALVLADLVLHKSYTSSEFNGVTALELGAGTGLVSIVLAQVGRTTFITDIGVEILDNCATNVHLNSGVLSFHENAVRVRELNWNEPWPPSVGTCNFPSQQRSRYSWGSSDIEEAERATLILAADVIYCDELTDSFFSILEKIMSQGSEKVLYLALEKRYNFSLDDLDVVVNGYGHFRSFLRREEWRRPGDTVLPPFLGKKMDLAHIPQYIREYERGKDLEIWKITYCSKKFPRSKSSF